MQGLKIMSFRYIYIYNLYIIMSFLYIYVLGRNDMILFKNEQKFNYNHPEGDPK